MNRQQLTEKHSLSNDIVFKLKTTVLTGKRLLKNIFSPVRKFKDKKEFITESIIAFSESELWNPFDNKDNWILTAGKIENLRIASQRLDGLEIKANEVFSFWKHVGNPNFGKGYVIGREVREGCIVPTIAGGLCQLSNGLYDAALKANFDIIERHKHTKVIKGSLAEQDRDATVKWNYIDLRFKSNFDFRIEAELTADKLIVRFRSKQKNTNSENGSCRPRQSNKLNDCYSCGNLACFKHPDKKSIKQGSAMTTFILDEKWLEFDDYIASIATESDVFIIPLKKNKLIKTDRYSWTASKPNNTKATAFQGIYRAIKLRYATRKNNVFELNLKLDKQLAQTAAKKIPIESTHVIISQNLLPFIFETGVLGGRTFDVLMTRLPMEKLHERLDFAHSRHPNSPTLKDFRASNDLITLENKALTKARKIITAHAEIAEIFKNKVEKLNWQIQDDSTEKPTGSKILFPASPLGRKGAYEMKKLAEELHLDLTCFGGVTEKENFWGDLKVDKFNEDFSQIALVVYPTYIENQPRQILKAISKGIPVITTTASGIEPSEKVKIFEIGDFDGIKHEIIRQMERFKVGSWSVRCSPSKAMSNTK